MPAEAPLQEAGTIQSETAAATGSTIQAALSDTAFIDVIKPGMDKASCIGKLRDTLDLSVVEMVYIRNAPLPGGNNSPAEQARVVSIPVRGPGDTRPVIKTILACF